MAARLKQSWQIEDITGTHFFLTFGGAEGKYVSDEGHAYPNPPLHREGEVGITGLLVLNPPEGTPYHKYFFSVDLMPPPGAKPDDPSTIPIVTMEEQKVCPDGTLSGTDHYGGESTRQKTTWSLTYTPDREPPPHVKPTLDLGHYEPEGMNNFSTHVMTALTPAYQSPEAVKPLTDAWMETFNLYLALRHPAMVEIQQRIVDLHREAGELWLFETPLPDDGAYEAKVAELEAAVRDWWDKRKEADAIYAGGAEKLADLVAAKHPKVAEALREAAKKLKEKGSGAFGAGD